MRVVVALMTVLLTACGTRLPNSAFVDTTTVAETATAPAARQLPDFDDGATDTTLPGAASVDGSLETTTRNNRNATSSNAASVARGPNQASDVGVTANTITLGTIVAENGVLGDAFAPAVRGLRAWTAAVNSKGGLGGRKVILKTCDDREDRARALACAQQLVERDKVFALVATNTRAMGGAAQYLNDQGIPVIGIPITNSFYRYPHFWSGYPTHYARDGKTVGYKGKLISSSGSYRWFKSHLGVQKAAVITYDIDESKQAGTFFAKGLELEGFEVTSYVVSFAAPSFDQAVADMQRKGTQLLLDGLDDGANRKLCDAMARRQFSVKAKVSTIVSFGESVGEGYNDTCRNSLYVTGQSLPYTSTEVPAIAEFRRSFARYQPGQKLHQWALEAWTQATMVADGIRSMGPTPTRRGLEDFLRSLRKYTAGGVLVGHDYAPVDFDAPTAESCFTIARWLDAKGGWTTATDRFPFCYPDAHQYATEPLEQGN